MTKIWIGALVCWMGVTAGGRDASQETPECVFLMDKGTKAIKEVKGSDLKDLAVKFPLPALTKTGNYTVIRFYIDASAGKNGETYVTLTKDAFLNRYKDQSEATFWLMKEYGKDDGSGNPTLDMSLRYIVESPRTAEKDVVNTVTVSMRIHVQTGTKDVWNAGQKSWDRVPVYDEGQLLAKGKLDVKLEKLTGARDKGGVLEVGLVDPQIKTFDLEDKCDGMNVKGLSFCLETGKNQYGNEAEWRSMRVFYISDEDIEIKTEGEGTSLDFVKKDILLWMKKEDGRKVWWGTTMIDISQMPEPEFLEIQEWKKEKIGANEWEVLRFSCPTGQVGKKKDEDDPETKYDRESISLVLGVMYVKPYVVFFSAPIVEDGYFGVPKKKNLERIGKVLDLTWSSVRVLKK